MSTLDDSALPQVVEVVIEFFGAGVQVAEERRRHLQVACHRPDQVVTERVLPAASGNLGLRDEPTTNVEPVDPVIALVLLHSQLVCQGALNAPSRQHHRARGA